MTAVDSRWHIKVSRGCIGTASCAGVAPAHFVLGPDNRSHPVSPIVAPDESVLDAVASCPMQAITVVNTETGAVVDA